MALRSPSRDAFHLLVVVVAVVVIGALYFARVVFVPLALAMLFAFVLTPIVKLFERIRVGRTLSTFLVVLLTLAGVGAIGWIVARQFTDVLNQLPEYQSNIKEKIDSLPFSTNLTLKNASATMNQLSKALALPPEAPSGKHSANTSSRPAQPLPVEVIKPASLPIESVQSALGLLLQVLIVIVFTVFMLLRRENLRDRFISLVGQQRLNVMTHALDEASDRVSRYLRTQLAVNAVYGAVIGMGLHWIGVPGGLLWGVVVGILRFLPYVGPPLGGIMPLLLSFAISHGWRGPVITLGLFVITELLVSNGIEPMLYGSQTGVAPFAVLVAAIFWTVLWGPIGLVLSTPLTVCLVVLGRHVPHLGFLPLLLGDEPVLTPDARVYQRLLAMDQEEAEQVLESLLEEKSLEEVYESVLIPALNLAEQDRHRDQLDEASEKFICQSTREIIADLYERRKECESHGINAEGVAQIQTEEALRAKVQRPSAIMCVPAGDEADEIVGIMLAQLLERAGHTAHCVRYGTNTEIIEQVQFEKPDVVCISALPPFVVSHTRSLYRALKAQSPDLEIVVGLWNFPGDMSKAARRIGMNKDSLPATKLADVVRQISDSQSVTTDARIAAWKA